MRMDPATGQLIDEEEDETPGGAVRQQEIAADVAPPLSIGAPPAPLALRNWRVSSGSSIYSNGTFGT